MGTGRAVVAVPVQLVEIILHRTAALVARGRVILSLAAQSLAAAEAAAEALRLQVLAVRAAVGQVGYPAA
jgi:hypothetical protein